MPSEVFVDHLSPPTPGDSPLVQADLPARSNYHIYLEGLAEALIDLASQVIKSGDENGAGTKSERALALKASCVKRLQDEQLRFLTVVGVGRTDGAVAEIGTETAAAKLRRAYFTQLFEKLVACPLLDFVEADLITDRELQIAVKQLREAYPDCLRISDRGMQGLLLDALHELQLKPLSFMQQYLEAGTAAADFFERRFVKPFVRCELDPDSFKWLRRYGALSETESCELVFRGVDHYSMNAPELRNFLRQFVESGVDFAELCRNKDLLVCGFGYYANELLAFRELFPQAARIIGLSNDREAVTKVNAELKQRESQGIEVIFGDMTALAALPLRNIALAFYSRVLTSEYLDSAIIQKALASTAATLMPRGLVLLQASNLPDLFLMARSAGLKKYYPAEPFTLNLSHMLCRATDYSEDSRWI